MQPLNQGAAVEAVEAAQATVARDLLQALGALQPLPVVNGVGCGVMAAHLRK